MSNPHSTPYPPQLSEKQLSSLISNVRDWQFTHGSLLKLAPATGAVLAHPIGVSLFPSLFPRAYFESARTLQPLYNELYAAVAGDEHWLHEVLEGLIRDDELAKTLWEIQLAVKKEGYVQDVSLGLFRSDYMLHVWPSDGSPPATVELKQVEFNTYSTAGGAHSNKSSEMHRYLQKTGAYRDSGHIITPESLPPSKTIDSLVSGLSAAHAAYGQPKSDISTQTGILFVVQPNNINICDERPLEYSLWEQNPPIPAYRIAFGEEIITRTRQTSSRELIYHPPSGPSSPIEISVIYMRAGYGVQEYDPAGYGSEARYQLERSRAIKCPSILSHLSTFKKVQQALAVPGTLEHFISHTKASQIAQTFVPIHPLDDSEAGLEARRLALHPKTAANYVLKPSLEGGGHNVYRQMIPSFLADIPRSELHKYVLMEMINAPERNNSLLYKDDVYSGPVVSELGIFGVCLWRTRGGRVEVLENYEAGFSFKTKGKDVDEMSAVKGYGCFDSPCLT